jgi:hypothetical protein
LRSGRLAVRLRCVPVGAGALPARCRGKLLLRTRTRTGTRTGTLGRASFAIPVGRTVTARMVLTRSA